MCVGQGDRSSGACSFVLIAAAVGRSVSRACRSISRAAYFPRGFLPADITDGDMR